MPSSESERATTTLGVQPAFSSAGQSSWAVAELLPGCFSLANAPSLRFGGLPMIYVRKRWSDGWWAQYNCERACGRANRSERRNLRLAKFVHFVQYWAGKYLSARTEQSEVAVATIGANDTNIHRLGGLLFIAEAVSDNYLGRAASLLLTRAEQLGRGRTTTRLLQLTKRSVIAVWGVANALRSEGAVGQLVGLGD